MAGNRNVADQAKQFWGTRNGRQKALLLGGVGVTVVLVAMFARLMSTPEYKPLYKDMPDERPSRVTFLLEPFKGQTRLTVTHDEFEDGSRIFGMISKGWPAVLSSLKSFLEMGRGLEPSWGEEERKRAGEA